jgi:lipopolysaccharide/colanic/teichoic acid biosynthesis glycosyltransferase
MDGLVMRDHQRTLEGPSPALLVAPSPHGARAAAVACRVLDVVVAAPLLLLLLPVLAAIAIAIRLDSPGPPVFRQRRMGRDLEPFTLNKFRTMVNNTKDETHRKYVLELIDGVGAPQGDDRPLFKLSNDTRVTGAGRLLRRSSLDELPQLWNVLVGNMSLVGPRPALQYEVERYPLEWMPRFAVKPGMTGLWQVSGRSELNLEQMMALDIEYVERRSLWLNICILARTIPVVLRGRGAA